VRGVILVLPTDTAGQQGPVASWVSTAGWATALARAAGESWIVTPSGVIPAAEIRRRASSPHLAPPSSEWRRHVWTTVKTAIKDVRDWRRARAFHVDPSGPWRGQPVAFVWQRHELFHTAGLDLAEALGVPGVLFVPAPLVWQARQWGVHRPGWTHLVERVGEKTPLARADLVACGSPLVAEEVMRLGVARDRIVITPTGVDPKLHESHGEAIPVRDALGLGNRFVVGWVGSFRRFHALDIALDAMIGVDDATLLLVGDGPEREHVEQRARDLGVALICTGTVSHDEVPDYLAAMDVALVVADARQPFHYSPLKLAEYMAAGRAVVVPRAGELPSQLRDGIDAVFVAPGDATALAGVLRDLRDDPRRRASLGAAARAAALERWSWDRSANTLLGAAERVKSRR
jgi:glycosyltransferase involved in cell wall biosynthesis